MEQKLGYKGELKEAMGASFLEQIPALETWDHVEVLGSEDMCSLFHEAADHKRRITNSIRHAQGKAELLSGKSASYFAAEAKKYENPDMEIGLPGDDPNSQLEPIDEGSSRRLFLSTTFNICGWCGHNTHNKSLGFWAQCGGCMIKTGCTLIHEHSDRADLRFNSPCLLKIASVSDILAEARFFQKEVERLSVEKERANSGIEHLRELMRSAPSKPRLASLRLLSEYKEEGDVFVWVGPGSSHKGVWARAVIWEHEQKDCFRFQTYLPVYSSGYPGRNKFVYKYWAPSVLQPHELTYLQMAVKSDPEFFKIWVENAVKLGDRYTSKFVSDLKKGGFVEPADDWNLTICGPVDSTKKALEVLQVDRPPTHLREWSLLRRLHRELLRKTRNYYGDHEKVLGWTDAHYSSINEAIDLLYPKEEDGED